MPPAQTWSESERVAALEQQMTQVSTRLSALTEATDRINESLAALQTHLDQAHPPPHGSPAGTSGSRPNGRLIQHMLQAQLGQASLLEEQMLFGVGAAAAGGAVVVGGWLVYDELMNDRRLNDQLLMDLRTILIGCDIPTELWEKFRSCFDAKDSADRGWRECTYILQDHCAPKKPDGSTDYDSDAAKDIWNWVGVHRDQIQDTVNWW